MGRRRRRSTFGSVVTRTGRPGFYVRVRVCGVERTRYAGPDRETATQVLADWHRKRSREDLLGEKAVAAVSLAKAKPALLDHLRARHADQTYATEESRLEEAERFFGTRALSDVTTAHVQDFLTYLRGEGRTGATLNRYAALLSVAFRFAKDRGWARSNPVAEIPREKEEVRALPFLSAKDVERLLAHEPDPTFRAYVRLLADSGLRRSEALRLEWRDVDAERGTVLVRRSKAKRPREVYLTAAAKAALAALREDRPTVPIQGPDVVWPALFALHPSCVTTRFDRMAARAGFPTLRLHDLRHGFCSRMAQAGVPVPTIAAMAGHSDLRVTQRYAAHLPTGATKDAVKTLEKAERAARKGSNPSRKGDRAGDQSNRARTKRAAATG